MPHLVAIQLSAKSLTHIYTHTSNTHRIKNKDNRDKRVQLLQQYARKV